MLTATYNQTGLVTNYSSITWKDGSTGVSLSVDNMGNTPGSLTVFYVRFVGESSSGGNSGMWIGIGAGALVAVLLILTGVVLWKRRRDRISEERRHLLI